MISSSGQAFIFGGSRKRWKLTKKILIMWATSATMSTATSSKPSKLTSLATLCIENADQLLRMDGRGQDE